MERNNFPAPLERETFLSQKGVGRYIFLDSSSECLNCCKSRARTFIGAIQGFIRLERKVTRPTVEGEEPTLPSAGTNSSLWKINLRLLTISTKLPVSVLTSRDNWTAFPPPIGEPNELGQLRAGTSGAEISSPPSFRTLEASVGHVPRRLPRRDGESSILESATKICSLPTIKNNSFSHRTLYLRINDFKNRVFPKQQRPLLSQSTMTNLLENIPC